MIAGNNGEEQSHAEVIAKAYDAMDVVLRLQAGLYRLPSPSGSYVAVYGLGENETVRLYW